MKPVTPLKKLKDLSELPQIFRNISKILEIKGDNPFRIRAYERAAENIGSIPNIGNFIRQDRLTDIPGIGPDLSAKIKEFSASGRIRMYEELKKSVPEGLLDLLRIPSVGPKTARLLYEKLKIKNIPGLEAAIKKNKLQGISGIKEKSVENILEGIEILKKRRERLTLAEADALAQEFLAPLKKMPEARMVSCAGSLRRQKETVRDIDILVASDKPQKIIKAFTKIGSARDVLAEGPTKCSLRTKDGVQVDCRIVEERSSGAALLYFTGSKNFNIKLRELAVKRGLKVNEYGVFRAGKFAAGRTEEEVFKLLGMAYIEPELREDSGEIELAGEFNLPELIGLKDIKGDLHTHSSWSDGTDSIAEMARYARETLGYSYIAVTDHSRSLKVARGLSAGDLKKKKEQIEKLNKNLRGFRVLCGSEADIDSAGRLDYPDSILKELDIVVAAIHSGFKQPRSQLTKRIIKACGNKYVHIIAHPTCKLWGERGPCDIDLDEVFKAAQQTNTFLEINAFPRRLDLDGSACRRAKEAGAKLAIGTDAHSSEQLGNVRFGVAAARRGWLEKDDVLNTLSLEGLLKAIKK